MGLLIVCCFVGLTLDYCTSFSGGDIASTFDHPELLKLGHCKLIEEVMIGEDTLIHFSGVQMGKYLHYDSVSFLHYLIVKSHISTIMLSICFVCL